MWATVPQRPTTAPRRDAGRAVASIRPGVFGDQHAPVNERGDLSPHLSHAGRVGGVDRSIPGIEILNGSYSLPGGRMSQRPLPDHRTLRPNRPPHRPQSSILYQALLALVMPQTNILARRSSTAPNPSPVSLSSHPGTSCTGYPRRSRPNRESRPETSATKRRLRGRRRRDGACFAEGLANARCRCVSGHLRPSGMSTGDSGWLIRRPPRCGERPRAWPRQWCRELPVELSS